MKLCSNLNAFVQTKSLRSQFLSLIILRYFFPFYIFILFNVGLLVTLFLNHSIRLLYHRKDTCCFTISFNSGISSFFQWGCSSMNCWYIFILLLCLSGSLLVTKKSLWAGGNTLLVWLYVFKVRLSSCSLTRCLLDWGRTWRGGFSWNRRVIAGNIRSGRAGGEGGSTLLSERGKYLRWTCGGIIFTWILQICSLKKPLLPMIAWMMIWR